MGKRGSAPMPTALKLVAGVKRNRINDDEPQPTEGVPQCPLSAAPEVHDVWTYTVRQLSHMRILTMADRDALYAYCEAVVMHRIASHVLATEGILQAGLHGGMVKHPAHQIQRDSAAIIKGYAQHFGLTPSARTSIKTTSAGETAKPLGAARLLSS